MLGKGGGFVPTLSVQGLGNGLLGVSGREFLEFVEMQVSPFPRVRS